MSVLKVNVGTASAPDWRKIGCGDGVTSGRLKLWDGSQWWRERCDVDAPTTLTDSFTGSDGTQLAGRALDTGGLSWSGNSVPVIASNKASIPSVGNLCILTSSDQSAVSADLALTGGLIQVDLYFLSTDGADGLNDSYLFRYLAFGNHYQVYRNGGFCPATTGAFDGSISAGPHNFSMTMVGGLLTCKVDGATVLTYNDPSPLTGPYMGISSPSGGGTFDNFSATAVIRRALKVNVGTPSTPDWQVAACMTPA